MVPKTSIRFNPETKQLDIQSPKDVEIHGLHATATNGMYRLDVDKYSAKNNIEVIRAVTEANAANAKKGAELVGTLIDAAK